MAWLITTLIVVPLIGALLVSATRNYARGVALVFLLIKIWGGRNRDRAATKFFLYTFLGSVAMLLSFLGIYFAKGTFDFGGLADLAKTGDFLTGNLKWFTFAGIFLGLAVKVPLFP